MCALIFTQYGRKIKKIRCDNEYASSDLTALVHKEGIVLEPCPAHEKNQNGVAERYNREKTLFLVPVCNRAERQFINHLAV